MGFTLVEKVLIASFVVLVLCYLVTPSITNQTIFTIVSIFGTISFLTLTGGLLYRFRHDISKEISAYMEREKEREKIRQQRKKELRKIYEEGQAYGAGVATGQHAVEAEHQQEISEERARRAYAHHIEGLVTPPAHKQQVRGGQSNRAYARHIENLVTPPGWKRKRK